MINVQIYKKQKDESCLFIDRREENGKLYIFYDEGRDIEKTKLTLNDISTILKKFCIAKIRIKNNNKK